MPTRTRSLYGGAIPGGQRFRVLFGTWQSQPSPWAAESFRYTCDDYSGNHLERSTPHGLNIEKTEIHVIPLNGTDASGNIYQGWYPTPMSLIPSHIAVGAPGDAECVTRLRTRTCPGRPLVSIPRFIAELRDMPHLVKQGGDLYRTYFRSGATVRARSQLEAGLRAAQDGLGIYLSTQFGTGPIVSDLRKLMHFQEQFKRRCDELNRLYSGSGLKRRLKLGTYTGQDDTTEAVVSGAGGTWYAQRTRVTTCDVWGTIRWKPTGPITNLPAWSPEIQHRARRALLGMGDQDLGDAWDIFPWSWMVEWFTNMGDILHTNSNRIPAVSSDACIMRHTRSRFVWRRLDHLEVRGGEGFTLRTTKHRSVDVPPAGPTFHLPMMDPWRLSIVGSLAATRHRRVAR